MKSAPVNWLPWSVLKMSGLPYLASAFPGDPAVGLLVGDHRVELTRDTTDAGLPVRVGVVQLDDLVDPVHEVRELLELRPLVVGRPHRDVDLDSLLDRRHGLLLLGVQELS